jgi:2-methylisocitrate lyase-like PEP mutase family enzyme
MTKPRALRDLIAEGKPIVTPTAHDALSARMLQNAGFRSLALGGSTMLAARFGLPDVGLAGFGEMLDAARDIVGAADIPAIVDADDGYGDAKSVVRTVHAYEEIGVAGLILEDQERTMKRPGDSAAVSVVQKDAMIAKLRAATAWRRNPDLLVVARTDSYALEGLDGVLRRCAAYLEAGADGLFVPGVGRLDHLEAIGRAFPGIYKLLVQVEGSATPWLPPSQLFDMGFTQIAYPSFVLNRMLAAFHSGCQQLHAAATDGVAPPLLPELSDVRAAFQAGVRAQWWRRIDEAPA